MNGPAVRPRQLEPRVRACRCSRLAGEDRGEVMGQAHGATLTSRVLECDEGSENLPTSAPSLEPTGGQAGGLALGHLDEGERLAGGDEKCAVCLADHFESAPESSA